MFPNEHSVSKTEEDEVADKHVRRDLSTVNIALKASQKKTAEEQKKKKISSWKHWKESLKTTTKNRIWAESSADVIQGSSVGFDGATAYWFTPAEDLTHSSERMVYPKCLFLNQSILRKEKKADSILVHLQGSLTGKQNGK